MDPVLHYYELTKKLLEVIHKLDHASERGEEILQLEQLLEERQHLLSIIHPPYSDEQKKYGTAAVELDKQLNQALQKLKMEIKTGILQLQQKKKNNAKYANPYESLNVDGMFYDRRK